MLGFLRRLSVAASPAAGFTVAVLVAGTLITREDVAWWDLLQYAGCLIALITFPGTIAWRLLWTGGRGTLLEHVVFGTVLGIVLQSPVYLLGVAIGAPRLTALLPLGTAVLVLLSRDRRRLLAPPTDPVGRLVAWTFAAASSYVLIWQTQVGWAFAPAWGRAPADPIPDQAFHLALVSELRHHALPSTPYLSGEPLPYHWLVNQFLAAMSWWARAPTWVLLDRLLLPTCVLLVLAATAAIGNRVTGRAGGGALAVTILAFVGDLSPFRSSWLWSDFDERFLAYFDPASPSLQFSVAMLLMLTMVVLHVLRTSVVGRRDLVLLCLATMLVPLAKGSALPLAIGGLACVVAHGLVLRPVRRRYLALLGFTGLVLVLWQLTVFQGAPGLEFHPLHLSGWAAGNLGLGGPFGVGQVPATPEVMVFATVGMLVSWLASAAGIVGFARGGAWRDPRPVFLVGSGLAGIVVALTFGHAGRAEDYFVRTTPALLAIASAWGLVLLVKDRPRRTASGLILGGMGGGFLLAAAAIVTAPGVVPDLTRENQHQLLALMLRPYAVISIGLLLLAGVLWWIVRRGRLGRAAALAVLLATVVGLGLVRVPGTFRAVGAPPPAYVGGPVQASIGSGAIGAATWIRDHSDVGDLLATNAHFVRPGSQDNRRFWLAALAERRVLVEGWGYTERAARTSVTSASPYTVPFWDSTLLDGNDAAFTEPSEERLDFLRDRGVRWLFVDDRFPVDLERLQQHAGLRFHAGDYWVLELPE